MMVEPYNPPLPEKMRSVLLVRHAKSSWDDSMMADFDRPLDERGKRDAPLMAKRLLGKNIAIDYFLSSPARRARKTAMYFLKAYGFDDTRLAFHQFLYLPAHHAFIEAIASAPDEFHHIALFSHNPGITDFANSLTDAVRIDNIPTCGVFGITLQIKHWKDFSSGKPEFWFFDAPKYPG